MMRINDLEIGDEVQVETGYTNWNRADNEFYCTMSGMEVLDGARDRMVSMPSFFPFTPCPFRHPQLLVWPLTRLSSALTTSLPQSQRHSHAFRFVRLLRKIGSARERTVSFPYRFPTRFGGFIVRP